MSATPNLYFRRRRATVGFLAAVALGGLALMLVPSAARADDGQGSCGAAECIDGTPVVPSLDPEWSANFVPPPVAHTRDATACIPTDVVAYTPTDWLRFAQKMRATMSPCASYYVLIPAVAGDKTRPRGPNQAPLIRALGPNFHAVNEINVGAATSWTRWVADGNGSWYDAGVEARRRMEDPDLGGFDVSAGDTWALNELTSAVRQGTGASRQNMRDFVHGLHDGDGGPPVKGIVWVSGIGQGTSFLDTYWGNVKSWLGDSAFWSDMTQYAGLFSQEVYGRIDKWAVPGTSPQDRLGPTADYLEHYASLASAGAYDTTSDVAASYLAAADAPIGNAAWSNSASFGWPSPAVDYVVAANYQAAQVYAFRHEQQARPAQAFGFAWQPTNPGLTPTDFNTQAAFILDRIAAAIRATDAPSADPGLAACGEDLSWCGGDLAGATFNTAWRVFHDWTQPQATSSKEVIEADAATPVPLSATDPDPGQQLTFSIVAQPEHGSATTDGGALAVYTPEPGYNGPDSFTFSANDGWLSSGNATVDLLIYALPAGGSFVVGDGSATGTVTFWSPSWWLANSLSAGPAPAGFKGFATRLDGTWSASPGFDHAPAIVPEWMGVVVASGVVKHGSTVTGDTRGTVVVHVDAYDPGLVGRGTVVASILGGDANR